jgi:hypothetical protein
MCKDKVYFAIFFIFTALFMMNEVLFSITPCRAVNIDWRFEEVFSLRNPDDSKRHRGPEKEF